ncbi:MAG: tyrosine-type recombinase/integrase [Deltaproteobacteria bacterium]|nr:tyrosine-type recombinase/integrase [Deltaproteobacteria bacterium]
MKGSIRTEQKCPKCKKAFKKKTLPGTTATFLICPACMTSPSRLFIDLYWKGERYRVWKDKRGNLLSSNEQANRLLEAIRREIDDHKFDPSHYFQKKAKPFYIRNVVEMWLAHNEQRASVDDLSPAMMQKKRTHAKKYFIPLLGDEDIRDIRAMDLHNFRMSLDLAPKTVKNILSDLSHLFGFAHELEMIERIPPFPRVKLQKPPIQAITEETQDKIINAIESHNQPIFRFLKATGCRPSMARALMWDCVDWENQVIVFKRNYSEGELREVLKNKRILYFPITSELADILGNVPRSLTGFVFINKKGKPYGKHIDRIWNRACKIVGVKIPLYAGVRHSFATNLLEQGVDLRVVADLMGHSSMEVTRTNYVQVKMKHLADVLEARKNYGSDRAVKKKGG